MPPIFPRNLCHFAALVPVDGCFWSAYIKRRTRLNFNETKNVRVPSDQVDFPSATRRAKIARYHHVTQLPQVEECVLFAASAGSLMPRSRIRRQHALSQPVQPMNNRSRDHARKHDG
jgi:hypothetical protein